MTGRHSKDERIEDAKDALVAKIPIKQPKKRRSRAKHAAPYTAPLPQKLTMIPCPCGRCSKFIVEPLFFSQDASIYKNQAEEVIKRYNEQPALWASLSQLINAWERITGVRVTGGYRARVEAIELWLKHDMKPAIDHARKAIGRPIPDIGA